MAELKRGLTAQQRMAELGRAREKQARARLVREVAGPRWRRMMAVAPVLFEREGSFEVRRIWAPAAVVQALRADAVFGLDQAMRLSAGFGFLSAGDVHVYLADASPLVRLAREGLLEPTPFADTLLVRPWPGPPRLMAAIVELLPPHRELPSGFRVVTPARLREELIGAVGARADLFALAERLLDGDG